MVFAEGVEAQGGAAEVIEDRDNLWGDGLGGGGLKFETRVRCLALDARV